MIGNSPFDQPWWLDIAAPNGWDEVCIEENGASIARFPYLVPRAGSYGATISTMPPMTPWLGPSFAAMDGKPSTVLGRRQAALADMLERLPAAGYFQQDFHPAAEIFYPLTQAGFSVEPRLTYRLKDISDTDAVWGMFRENIRREIRKAQRQLTVVSDAPLDILVDLNAKTYRNQGKSVKTDPDLLGALAEAAAARECGTIMAAMDEAGQAHAALFLVWDQACAYYVHGGTDPETRTNGAMSLLLWNAIQTAAKNAEGFDFEGSMHAPIERYFRAFGGEQQVYWRVSKSTGLYRWAQAYRLARGGS
ncbi:GNAT family N-acetyltransferase [Hwanghaeella grinnelliae]|uniref:GNAT family N-acetyltransferase n=1 Tax=Hwanghaeella grinnelliae TaxID=2500179 RepID=A0A437QQF3_9PROT|nr:GNAT family N-acetyltransferase [Hwanghaeella grinnelliae]RVU36751.1 GNAT family N-acetyltransferase [Hwanghaeella grinnelliae]